MKGHDMKVYNQHLIESVDNCFDFVCYLGVTAVYQAINIDGDKVVAHITPLEYAHDKITWYDILKLNCEVISAYKPK